MFLAVVRADAWALSCCPIVEFAPFGASTRAATVRLVLQLSVMRARALSAPCTVVGHWAQNLDAVGMSAVTVSPRRGTTRRLWPTTLPGLGCRVRLKISRPQAVRLLYQGIPPEF